MDLESGFVGDVIFIIIIIIISLFRVCLMNPKCWTHRSQRMYPGDGQVEKGSRRWECWDSCLWHNRHGAIGRQTFWLRCTFSCKYFANLPLKYDRKAHQRTVYLLYNPKQSWEVVMSCQVWAYCHGRECNSASLCWNENITYCNIR